MSDLLPGERIDDLQRDGLMLIQRRDKFCFGADAVLLANYAKLHRGDKVLDMCTGTGVIPVLLSSSKLAENITGMDIDADCIDMAQRSAERNGIGDTVKFVCGDVRDIRGCYGGVCDVVTVNPPYGDASREDAGAQGAARHELTCGLADVMAAAARVLVNRGRFYIVYKPQRLPELFAAMTGSGIEPKRMRFVSANLGKAPWCVLVEGRKQGGAGLEVEPTLYLNDESGSYTAEARRIYHMDAEE